MGIPSDANPTMFFTGVDIKENTLIAECVAEWFILQVRLPGMRIY